MINHIKQVGILVDVPRCIGCNQCVIACVESNQLGAANTLIQHSPDGLSAQRWTSIVEGPEGGYIRKVCQHCLKPACVSVCPVGAMYRTDQGIVLYDSKKCMGCRYCMMACPYGIPRYEWNKTVPLVKKCTLCFERLQNEQLPACVENCPEQVISFGEREDLLSIANQRVKASPDIYLPKIYGANEVGGTSVIYITNVPLEFLGYYQAPIDEPMPELTGRWLNKVPGITVGMTGLLSGLFWIIDRRIKAEHTRNTNSERQSGQGFEDGL